MLDGILAGQKPGANGGAVTLDLRSDDAYKWLYNWGRERIISVHVTVSYRAA